MITTNEFNTSWWGKPVGNVSDDRFFSLPAEQQRAGLEMYEWVEFRMPLESNQVDFRSIRRAGFFQVDTQLTYRLGLTKLESPSSLDTLTVEFADEAPFEVRAVDMKPFEHERYFKLPGITPEHVDERYARWSNQLVTKHPATCLRIMHEGRVEGWYLGDDSKGVGLNLTLAMLSRDAGISGMLLFLKAYQAFASRGHRLGWASFSVQNTAVHNIYAAIGARFLPPVGHWLWIR